MKNIFSLKIKSKIPTFNKTISVEGDKSISHRALLLASQTNGISKIKGILESEDVLSTINALKELGVRIIKIKSEYLVYGNGLNSFHLKKNVKINANNSGTLARLLMGLLSTSNNKFKIVGDRSLNKRPMQRIIKPLEKVGCFFFPRTKSSLPITIMGTDMPLAQKHVENIGSAQVKTAILFSALNTPGITEIEERKTSRDHTERMLAFIGADIKIIKKKEKNFIFLKGQKELNAFKYKIPGDLSSAAFFVVLTLLRKNSKLKIKNLNYNFTRLGFVEILKKMNAKIIIINKRKISNEIVCDMIIKSSILKSIICSSKIVPRAIDEFPILMVAAALAKGQTKFNGLEELNKKESPRLILMNRLLNQIGVKTKVTKKSINIFGNPNLKLKNKISINPNMDHRLSMTGFVLGQIIGGPINIKSFNTVNTSFPTFLKIMKNLGAKYEIKKKY